MAKNPSPFDVMKRMSAENKDILMFPDVVSVKTVSQHNGHVTIGVPHEFAVKMAVGTPKYKVFMLALNEVQFEEMSAAMAAETPA